MRWFDKGGGIDKVSSIRRLCNNEVVSKDELG